VEVQVHPVDVGILVEVVDPRRIERAGAADDAVDFVAFGKKKVGQIGSVLSGDSGDECFFHGLVDE